MATIDYLDGLDKAKKKIKATETFREASEDYKSFKQNATDNVEELKSDAITQLNKAKETKKRFEKKVKTQFEQLLDLTIPGFGSRNREKNSDKTSPNSRRYIKSKMIQAIKKIEPEIIEILFEESLRSLGCSHEQSYNSGVPIYVRVQSIDLFKILKLEPDEAVGKSIFEKESIVVGSYPFAMNKELYHRIQSTVSYNTEYFSDYVGRSGQNLFDIQYVTMNGFGEIGDFYKITLRDRITLGLPNPTNKVGDLLRDYYATINIIDYKTIFARLLDGLTGMISIQANLGYGEIEDSTKFSLLIQRILGLCFDSRSEIDVGGTAKIAELDGFDDSFFEFSEIDLRNIDRRIQDIKNGVVEFESCSDVKLPVNSSQLLDAVNQMNFIDSQSDLDSFADGLSDVISDNPNWQLFFPNSIDIKIAVDLDFIKQLPKSLILTLLSPKVLLPIFTMLQAIQQLGPNAVNAICSDKINSAQDFMKCFKTFMKNLVSKIGGLFVRELFLLIKKDIMLLIQSVITDILKEKQLKKYAIILKLVTLLLIVAQLINDWRKCKSVIDEILALLELATSGFSNSVPLPLLAAAQLCGGYSASKAMINSIEEMQSVGLPTGPLPDGSPNLHLASTFATLKGQEKENQESGVSQCFGGPFAISPAGLTIPKKIWCKTT